MSEDNGTSLEASKDGFKISGKKTSELIAAFALLIMGVLAYGFWEHKTDSKVESKQVSEAILALSKAIADQAIAQRVTNCLIATRQEEREAKIISCERQAK